MLAKIPLGRGAIRIRAIRKGALALSPFSVSIKVSHSHTQGSAVSVRKSKHTEPKRVFNINM